jgi:hypothetical protein
MKIRVRLLRAHSSVFTEREVRERARRAVEKHLGRPAETDQEYHDTVKLLLENKRATRN